MTDLTNEVSKIAVGSAENVAESAVSSVATSALSNVATTAISAVNPVSGVFSLIKIGLVLSFISGFAYAGYEVYAYIRDAEDAKQALAVSKQAIEESNNNLIAIQAQHEEVLKQAQQAKNDAEKRNTNLQKTLSELKNAPKSQGCIPSPAAKSALDSLR